MNLDKIYFDMDGVLADFDGGIFELTPFDGELDKDQKNNDDVWQLIRNVSHFYYKLRPIKEMVKLLEMLYNKYGNKCEILTGIPRPKREIFTASEDKISWVKKYIGDHIKVNIVYKEEKINFCKGKNSVLIDDLAETINDWNKIGGTGILHKDFETTKIALQKLGLIE